MRPVTERDLDSLIEEAQAITTQGHATVIRGERTQHTAVQPEQEPSRLPRTVRRLLDWLTC